MSEVAGRLTTGQAVSLHLLCWCWLHDLAGGDTMGLLSDGTAKKAWAAWQALHGPADS